MVSSRSVRFVVPFTAVMIVLMGSARTMSQVPASTSLPQTADGQPAIHGFWWAGLLPGQASLGGFAGSDSQTSVIVDPADGKVPYQPWAAAAYEGLHARHNVFPVKPEDTDPQARCAPAGIPRVHNHVTAFQILQPAGHVIFLYQYPRSLHRSVPLDGRPHLGTNIPLWMGDSRGRWEGNTLVVDITNTNAQTWLDQVGGFHSDALHMVERFTVVDADTIQYQTTLTDPKVYTRPWTVAWELKRQKDEHLQAFIIESECNEAGNPGLYAIMGTEHSQSTTQEQVER